MAAKIVDLYKKEGGNSKPPGGVATKGGAKATKDYSPPVSTSGKK